MTSWGPGSGCCSFQNKTPPFCLSITKNIRDLMEKTFTQISKEKNIPLMSLYPPPPPPPLTNEICMSHTLKHTHCTLAAISSVTAWSLLLFPACAFSASRLLVVSSLCLRFLLPTCCFNLPFPNDWIPRLCFCHFACLCFNAAALLNLTPTRHCSRFRWSNQHLSLWLP